MCETTPRREAEGSSLTHPTPRDQEFLLLLEINHVVFVLQYLINIMHVMRHARQLNLTNHISWLPNKYL